MTDTERIALKELRAKLEKKIKPKGPRGGQSLPDAFYNFGIKDAIVELDAQEKAGVKAEICNAWHGNDFSQCQLPKGHEGNHLCIMTWEWPTASNAASEQEKSL